MATTVAILESRVEEMEAANQAMHIRKSRKRKAFNTDKPLSFPEMQSVVEQEEVEAQIQDELPRPIKRISRCSKCNSTKHTARTCVA